MSKSILPALVIAALVGSGGVLAQSSVAHINGKADTGNTVSVENVETGYSRDVTVGKNGRFQFRSLPTGTYDVVIRDPSGEIVKSQLVALRVGSTASVKQGPRDAELAAGAKQQAGGGGDDHRERAPAHDAERADQGLRPARDAGAGAQRAEPQQ